MLEILRKQVADYSSGDWDAFQSAFASEGSFEEVATRQVAKTAEEYTKLTQRWKKAFPDSKGTVLAAFESGDNCVIEVEWEGTQSGPLDGPFGTLPPSNKRGRVKAVIVATVKNDKITEMRHYFDLLTILAQLGIAPMAGVGTQAPGKPGEMPPARH